MSARRERGQAEAPTPERPRPTPSQRDEPLRAEGKEHLGPQRDRPRPERPEHGRPAQAGADLQDPAGPGREGRADLRRGRAGGPARRVRVPARARLQLSAGPRRHLRLAVADPALRPPHRRHHLGPGAAAQGHRALLRAAQGRGDQLRDARAGAREDLLRQPHAALSDGAAAPRARHREPDHPRDGSPVPDRQGPARA